MDTVAQFNEELILTLRKSSVHHQLDPDQLYPQVIPDLERYMTFKLAHYQKAFGLNKEDKLSIYYLQSVWKDLKTEWERLTRKNICLELVMVFRFQTNAIELEYVSPGHPFPTPAELANKPQYRYKPDAAAFSPASPPPNKRQCLPAAMSAAALPDQDNLTEALQKLVLATPGKRSIQESNELKFVDSIFSENIKPQSFCIYGPLPHLSDRSLLDEARKNRNYHFTSPNLPDKASVDAHFDLVSNKWRIAMKQYYGPRFSNFIPTAAAFITQVLFELSSNPCLIIFEFIREYLRDEGIIIFSVESLISDKSCLTLHLLEFEDNHFHFTLHYFAAITQLMDNSNIMHESQIIGGIMRHPLMIKLLVKISIPIADMRTMTLKITPITCKIEASPLLPHIADSIKNIQQSQRPNKALFDRVYNKCFKPIYKTSYCFKSPLLLQHDFTKLMPQYNNALLAYALTHPLDPELRQKLQGSLLHDLDRSSMNIFESMPACPAISFEEKYAAYKSHCLFKLNGNQAAAHELMLLIPQIGLNPFHYYKTVFAQYLWETTKVSFSKKINEGTTMWLHQRPDGSYYLKCQIEYCSITVDNGTVLHSPDVPVLSLIGIINLVPGARPWCSEFYCYLEPAAVMYLSDSNKLTDLIVTAKETLNPHFKLDIPRPLFIYEESYKNNTL